MPLRIGLTLCTLTFALCSTAAAADWVHWRGPEQNGFSKEKGLPGEFDPTTPGKNNLVWKAPYGGRSSPLVLDGRLYVVSGTGEGAEESERMACLNADTGTLLWEHKVNVFHTDIVSSRLGWAPLSADPETGTVFVQFTGGQLQAIDKAGKVVWGRSLTEEYGRISGYGGRISAPLFDSGLVLMPMVNSSWGDQARAGNRIVAFDAKTGAVVWWTELTSPTRPIKGTYYSNPVVAVIGGQRLLITGGADGALHAVKVRSGERVWSYQFGAGVVNGSPVVDGNLVYCGHGEENPEGGSLGRIVCVDGSQLEANKKDPQAKQPKLVWEYRKAQRFGLASPALAEGKLYIPDDGGELFCFDAKKGKVLWRKRYGTEARGGPLVADGKLYIFDVKGKLVIFTLNGDAEPEEEFDVRFRGVGGGINETNGTPIAVNGRLYFTTRTDCYCVAKDGAKGEGVSYKPLGDEAPAKGDAAPASIRLFPADVTAKPGEAVKLEVKFLDAHGREVKAPADAKVEWSLPQPPLPPTAPKGANPPPALNAEAKGEGTTGTVTLGKMPRQAGKVVAKVGTLVGEARVRVAAAVPHADDFEKTPAGAPPGGWVNAQSKFVVVEKGGKKVLSKVNTDSRPPFARANGYVTLPTATDYTAKVDVMGTKVRDKLPDAGLVNARYTLILDGKTDPDTGKRQVRLVSWEARPRINTGADFDWQPDTWYTLKLAVEQKEKTAMVRAKVWKAGEAEPDKWTVEFEDKSPNREGSAAVYGYISNITDTEAGSDIFYDNLSVTPNGK